jgi:hypothetical protein
MAQTEEEQDTSRATNDAYTGMLAISLIALLAGAALLYLDWDQYPTKEPPTKVTAPKPSMVAPPQQQQPPQQMPPMNVQPMDKGAQPMPPMDDKKGG